MAQNYSQSTSAPDNGSILACSDSTGLADGSVAAIEIGTTLTGSSAVTRTVQNSASTGNAQAVGLVMETIAGEPGTTVWEAGNWNVRQNVVTASTEVVWESVDICRISSAGSTLSSVASASGINMPMTAGIHETTVAGSSVVGASTGDKVYITCEYTFMGTHGNVSFDVAPNTTIISPVSTAAAAVAQKKFGGNYQRRRRTMMQ